MKNRITITHNIYINIKPDELWDFTQDYSKRSVWDKSITSAKVIKPDSPRVVDVFFSRNAKATLVYKLDSRPKKTTLVMTKVNSFFIKKGGGSWTYIAKDNGTIWTQTNALVLKENLLCFLFRGIIRTILLRNTKKAMNNVKQLMEQEKLHVFIP